MKETVRVQVVSSERSSESSVPQRAQVVDAPFKVEGESEWRGRSAVVAPAPVRKAAPAAVRDRCVSCGRPAELRVPVVPFVKVSMCKRCRRVGVTLLQLLR